jgi:single-strand DNA-binding protein
MFCLLCLICGNFAVAACRLCKYCVYARADLEIRTLESGHKVANFRIATNSSYTNHKGERVEDTQWHPIVAWGKLAEINEKFLTKGKKVAIEGKLVHRIYETKDGEKRYITEVNCDELMIL